MVGKGLSCQNGDTTSKADPTPQGSAQPAGVWRLVLLTDGVMEFKRPGKHRPGDALALTLSRREGELLKYPAIWLDSADSDRLQRHHHLQLAGGAAQRLEGALYPFQRHEIGACQHVVHRHSPRPHQL